MQQFNEDLRVIVPPKWNRLEKRATCYCIEGYTYDLCQHKLALEMKQGALAKPVVLVPNKGPGRKRKATRALERSDIQ